MVWCSAATSVRARSHSALALEARSSARGQSLLQVSQRTSQRIHEPYQASCRRLYHTRATRSIIAPAVRRRRRSGAAVHDGVAEQPEQPDDDGDGDTDAGDDEDRDDE